MGQVYMYSCLYIILELLFTFMCVYSLQSFYDNKKRILTVSVVVQHYLLNRFYNILILGIRIICLHLYLALLKILATLELELFNL